MISDLNVGLLYVLALSSLGVYGVVLGGWASNSKFSLLGGVRSAAQMISYELALGLSLVPVVMLAGSFSLVDIVDSQAALSLYPGAAAGLRHLSDRRHRRGKTDALRSAGGGKRTDGRLPYRIQRHALSPSIFLANMST